MRALTSLRRVPATKREPRGSRRRGEHGRRSDLLGLEARTTARSERQPGGSPPSPNGRAASTARLSPGPARPVGEVEPGSKPAATAGEALARRPKGSLGVSRLDGKEDEIRRFLELGVSNCGTEPGRGSATGSPASNLLAAIIIYSRRSAGSTSTAPLTCTGLDGDLERAPPSPPG